MNPPEAVQKMIELSDGGRRFRASGWELLHPGPEWMAGAEISNEQPEDGPTEYCCERYAEHATAADQDLWTFALEGWLLQEGLMLVPGGDMFTWATQMEFKDNHCVQWYDSRTAAAIAAAEAVIGKGEG